jgi:hypothetical protein
MHDFIVVVLSDKSCLLGGADLLEAWCGYSPAQFFLKNNNNIY